MNIEELVRAAQERQAERAAPPDRIRAELPGLIARARRRRLGVAGAAVTAVAATAAIAVPAIVLRDPPESPAAPTAAASPPASASASASAPAPAPTDFTVAALGYRPAWLPPGLAEHRRTATAADPGDDRGPTLQRTWKPPSAAADAWGGPELTLYVNIAVPEERPTVDTSGKRVDINGATGYYGGTPGEQKSFVAWAPTEHTALMVTAAGLDISQADLLRVARSVRPEKGSFATPVRLPRLPDGWTATGFEGSGATPATWRADVFAAEWGAPESRPKDSAEAATKLGRGGPGSLTVTVAGGTDAPDGGDKLTVGGRPARHPVRTDQAGQDLIYLVVELGRGRLMTLIGQGAELTLKDLVAVAEHAEIDSSGMGWLGGRS